MGMLCFFPWLHLNEPIDGAGLEVIPLRRGESSERLTPEEREAVELILEPYLERSGDPASRFVVVRLEGTSLLDDLDEEQRREVFDFAELLAFSSMATREFFPYTGVGSYSNRTHFQVFVQRFEEPGAGIGIETRRRDGRNKTGSATGSYRFQKPDHVVATSDVLVDGALLSALMASADGEWWPRVWEGILGFNLANSDSHELRPSVELVLLNGAFERVLIGHGKEDELVKALTSVIAPTEDRMPADCPRLASALAAGRFVDAGSVREAWMRDLFRSRNDLAHGKSSASYPASWAVDEHLLLGSFLYPRVVKVILATKEKYELTEHDLASIDAFERLACEDLFVEPPDDGDGMPGQWSWNRVMKEIDSERLNMKVVAYLEGLDPSNKS